MSIARLPVVFKAVLILVVCQRCRSCQNAPGNFQQILKRHQLSGRLMAHTGMKIFRRFVFTKMECLDICLRTEECFSFDMQQTQSTDGTTFWFCVINRKVNSQGIVPVMAGHHKGWIHFNVSSQQLQEVSCFRYQTTQLSEQKGGLL